MPIFQCEGEIKTTTTIDTEIIAVDRHAAARTFRALYGGYPDSVGSDIVIGTCDDCENALFVGEDYSYDSTDGVKMCRTCCPLDELAKMADADEEEDDER